MEFTEIQKETARPIISDFEKASVASIGDLVILVPDADAESVSLTTEVIHKVAHHGIADTWPKESRSGRRGVYDCDPFDIKANENSYDNEHRCIVKSYKRKRKGSPYRDWVEKVGGYDPINLEKYSEEDLGRGQILMSAKWERYWTALHDLMPNLKGRQKQILTLLLDGEWNQTEIAEQLGMKQPDVCHAIGMIRKKILKKVP